MMSSVIFFVVTLVLCVPICCGISFCGLESLVKCSPDDLQCLSELDRSLLAWCQSYEAIGYCVDPIDPLFLEELAFDVQSTRFIFRNVSIAGLSQGHLSIETVPDFEGVRETYTHRLEFDASSYYLTDLKWGKNLEFPTPVKFSFSKAKATTKVLQRERERCDRTTHLYLKPLQIKVHGGRTNIISGFDAAHHGVNAGDFGMELLKEVVQRSTEKLYVAKKQIFSIAPYEVFFNPHNYGN